MPPEASIAPEVIPTGAPQTEATAPPSRAGQWAEPWDNPEQLPRLSAAWPLLWFGVLLFACVLWGYFNGG